MTWEISKGKGIDDYLVDSNLISNVIDNSEENAFKIISLNEKDTANYLHEHFYSSSEIKAVWEKLGLKKILNIGHKTAQGLVRDCAKRRKKGSSELETIEIMEGELHNIVNKAEQILIEQNSGIYQRGGFLVRMARAGKTSKVVRRESNDYLLKNDR